VHRTVEAIQAGEVPPPLQEELLAGAQELLHGIPCAPEEAPPPGEEPPPPTGDRDDDDDDDDDDHEDDDD
jgi:hypothetical protein